MQERACELIGLTCRWCVGCKRAEQGTPAPLWSGERAGLGRVSHEAAQVTDSNEVSPEPERCQSSTGLKGQRSL